MLLLSHFRGEETASERWSHPPKITQLSSSSCCALWGVPQALMASRSPQVQLVPHGVVAVREGPHLALLARQVLAELVAVVLQRATRVLGGLQLAVQPQHAGLLLQQLPSLALAGEGTQRDGPSQLHEMPRRPTLPQKLVQAVTPPTRRPLGPHLQLADPLLQGARASGDGGLLCQHRLEASDDLVCVPDLPLQTQGSLRSATGEAEGQPPRWPHRRCPARGSLPARRALTSPGRGCREPARHCTCS